MFAFRSVSTRLELRQEGRELRRKPGELLEELPGAGVRRVVRSLREVVEARLERADLLVELLLEVLAGPRGREGRGREDRRRASTWSSASSSFSRKSSGVSVSPLTSASDVIEARQSPMSLHTASAHSAVDGDSSSVKRMTTAAMTIAATPITTAAMNQFLRTVSESSAPPRDGCRAARGMPCAPPRQGTRSAPTPRAPATTTTGSAPGGTRC